MVWAHSMACPGAVEAGCMIGGMIGLLVECALEEAVGDGSLSGSAVLAAPKAAEL